MATRHTCPKCGGVIIRDDRGERAITPKGVNYIPSGNDCNCDRKKKYALDGKEVKDESA